MAIPRASTRTLRGRPGRLRTVRAAPARAPAVTAGALLLVAAGVVAFAPRWWAERVGAVTAAAGRHWPALLPLATGAGLLLWLVGRRWSRGVTRRRRPVAERVPLFGHVTLLLLLAVAVAALTGWLMWLTLGRPARAPAAAPGWTVQNTFDAVKIVLSVVAGIGGVIALTVAYRKQGHAESAERREDTRLFTDRFGRAADQLGADKAAVRLAGVYALAALADDWADGRQRCIDVLCAYLRMPPPGTGRTGGRDRAAERQVRHSVIRVITDHLRAGGHAPSWRGHDLDFTGAVLDGGTFHGAVFPGGTVSFREAVFSGGTVSFDEAVFSGGVVDFDGATFAGGTVSFAGAAFTGGEVTFRDAVFAGGEVVLERPQRWDRPPVFSPGVGLRPPAGLRLPDRSARDG